MDLSEIAGIVVVVVPAVVTAASAVAAVTPTPKDDEALGKIKRIWAKVYPVVDALALNVGKAKQRPDEASQAEPERNPCDEIGRARTALEVADKVLGALLSGKKRG